MVDPAAISFAEQRAAFATAGVIVGPHGAGLANMIMSHDATVVELFSPAYVNGSCYTLAEALGHDVLVRDRGAEACAVTSGSTYSVEATLDEALRETGSKSSER